MITALTIYLLSRSWNEKNSDRVVWFYGLIILIALMQDIKLLTL